MVSHTENSKDGIFYIEKDNVNIAEMTYSLPDENTMEIDHTEVDKKEQGNNLGEELVGAGVNFARETGMKIIPSCSFAKAVFERKGKEWADVLQ